MEKVKSGSGFSSQIKSMRLDKEATLKEVADHLGFSPMYISDVENERRSPFADDVIRKLANFYNANADYLIDLARLSRKKLELGIENLNKNQESLALSLARKWDNMDNETIERLNNILNNNR